MRYWISLWAMGLLGCGRFDDLGGGQSGAESGSDSDSEDCDDAVREPAPNPATEAGSLDFAWGDYGGFGSNDATLDDGDGGTTAAVVTVSLDGEVDWVLADCDERYEAEALVVIDAGDVFYAEIAGTVFLREADQATFSGEASVADLDGALVDPEAGWVGTVDASGYDVGGGWSFVVENQEGAKLTVDAL